MGRIATQPVLSQGSQQRGQNQNWLPHPCLLRGPRSGRNCSATRAFSGSQQRGQNQNWLPNPCLLRGPQVGGIATQPVLSQGSPAKGTKSKVAALGARSKTVHMQPKRISPKIFHTKPLEPPPWTTFKKGGGFRNPSWYRIPENPPPCIKPDRLCKLGCIPNAPGDV